MAHNSTVDVFSTGQRGAESLQLLHFLSCEGEVCVVFLWASFWKSALIRSSTTYGVCLEHRRRVAACTRVFSLCCVCLTPSPGLSWQINQIRLGRVHEQEVLLTCDESGTVCVFFLKDLSKPPLVTKNTCRGAWSLCCCNQGAFIASGSNEHVVTCYNMVDGECRGPPLRVHTHNIPCIGVCAVFRPPLSCLPLLS